MLKNLQTLSLERGAHVECVYLDASEGDACDGCVDIINGVFFDMYNHAKSAEGLVSLVLNDIREENL